MFTECGIRTLGEFLWQNVKIQAIILNFKDETQPPHTEESVRANLAKVHSIYNYLSKRNALVQKMVLNINCTYPSALKELNEALVQNTFIEKLEIGFVIFFLRDCEKR